jgi:hypothetical protein
VPKWSKVGKGDRVQLRGREYEVVKIKPKGKRAKVTVRGGGSVFESTVALSDKVTIVKAADKRRDADGWYKPTKAQRAAEPGRSLPPGDPSVTTPPLHAVGSPWESRRDKVEERLERVLGAVLVGEATDESAGYYVPPVDVTTVDAHLVLFHGWQPSDWDEDTDRVKAHEAEHADRLGNPEGYTPLPVNHWHTERRPA